MGAWQDISDENNGTQPWINTAGKADTAFRVRVTWSNGVGAPVEAFSPSVLVVAAPVVTGEGLVDRGDGTAVFTTEGEPVEIVQPSLYAGNYTVPPGTAPVLAEAIAVKGANRVDGEITVERALWWIDNAVGEITYKWDILHNGSIVPGGPQTNIDAPTWAFRIPDSLRGQTITVRETLTQNGVAYTSTSAPFAISNALPKRFIDRLLVSGSAQKLNLLAFETGFTWARIDGGGSNGVSVSSSGAFSSIGSSNKPAFIRNQTVTADQYCGAVLQRGDYSTIAESSHISPAVRLSNPTAVQNAITCYRPTFQIIGGVGVFRIIKMLNGAETILQTIQNNGFEFDTDEDVVDLMLAVQGSALTMFINGEGQESVTDSDIASGNIGIVSRGGSNPGLLMTSFYGDSFNG